MHHSLVYACPLETAQPKVEALVRKSGPGPYNQLDMRMLCEAFYLVSCRVAVHCSAQLSQQQPPEHSKMLTRCAAARRADSLQVGPAPTDPTYTFPDDAGLPFGKGKCTQHAARCLFLLRALSTPPARH